MCGRSNDRRIERERKRGGKFNYKLNGATKSCFTKHTSNIIFSSYSVFCNEVENWSQVNGNISHVYNYVILTCISAIISSGNEFVLHVLWAHSEVVILSIAFVALPIAQLNTQYLTFEECQQVKIVVTCIRRHIICCQQAALKFCKTCVAMKFVDDDDDDDGDDDNSNIRAVQNVTPFTSSLGLFALTASLREIVSTFKQEA